MFRDVQLLVVALGAFVASCSSRGPGAGEDDESASTQGDASPSSSTEGSSRGDGDLIGARCYPTCDPLLAGADCFVTDDVCLPNSGDGKFVCLGSTGAVPYGAECKNANSCNQGLLCVDEAWVPDCTAESCCTPVCDLMAPTCPDETLGVSCTAWHELGMAPAGWEHVGVCRLPS